MLETNENIDKTAEVFVRQLLLIIHFCHSHNVVGSMRRLHDAVLLFRSTIDSSVESGKKYGNAFDIIISHLIEKLRKLRYIDSGQRQDIESIKNECFALARSLSGSPDELQRKVALLEKTQIEGKKTISLSA